MSEGGAWAPCRAASVVGGVPAQQVCQLTGVPAGSLIWEPLSDLLWQLRHSRALRSGCLRSALAGERRALGRLALRTESRDGRVSVSGGRDSGEEMRPFRTAAAPLLTRVSAGTDALGRWHLVVPVCWGSEARLEDHSTSQRVFPPSCSLECGAWGPDDGSPEWMDSLWGLSSPISCQAACEGGAPPPRFLPWDVGVCPVV